MQNIIYGRNVVFEAIKEESRPIKRILITRGLKGEIINQIIEIARRKNVGIEYVDKYKLKELAGDANHQGVIARVGEKAVMTLSEFLDSLNGKIPFLCLLDHISDPHNLGSIIRSAYLCGVDGIIIPERRACGVTPTVVKVSSGATEYIPVIQVTNLVYAIDEIKKKNIWVVGADTSGEVCFEKDLTFPIALVIGSEGEGLHRLVKESCDLLIKIPILGKISSLNASCAAAILMCEVMRQRKYMNK